MEIENIATIFQGHLKQINYFCKTDIGKMEVDGFTRPRRESDVYYKFCLSPYYRSLSADRDFLYKLLLNSRFAMGNDLK